MSWRTWIAPQPSILSFWADTLGLHAVPIVCLALMVFMPASIQGTANFLYSWPIGVILFLDWGHIFAQWMRIYSNPMESARNRWFYPLSLFGVFACFYFYLSWGGRGLSVFLVYFVIFHFMKQQYGYLRYFGRGEYRNHAWGRPLEDLYFYLGVVTPIVGWHVRTPVPLALGPWPDAFFRHPWLGVLHGTLFYAHLLVTVLYWGFQVHLWRRDKFIPLSKYLALLFPHLAWGMVAWLPSYQLLFWVMVVFYHDLSYFFFVWAVARRDQRLPTALPPRKTLWTSVWALPFYVLVVALLANVIGWMGGVAQRFNGEADLFHLMKLFPEAWQWQVRETLNDFLAGIDRESLRNFGFAWIFAIQAHHYFIDRYLWKKEKDALWAWSRRSRATSS